MRIDKWCSTPPDKSNWVLVCAYRADTPRFCRPHVVLVGRYFEGEWQLLISGEWAVTHWMPLPELPKETKPLSSAQDCIVQWAKGFKL